MNNEHVIILLKTGTIYAIDNNFNVKHFKNLSINSLFAEKVSKSTNKEKSSEIYENIKIFSSSNLDKIVISNGSLLTIWYQSDLISANSNNTQKIKQITKNSTIEELTGTFYNISLESEKKNLLRDIPNPNILNTLGNKNHFDYTAASFGNNYYHGSHTRITYLLMFPTYENGLSFKLVLIDYLFKYDLSNRLKAADYENNSENLNTIDKKILYTYLNYELEKSTDNLNKIKMKERILMKFNNSGNSCIIVINNHHAVNSYLIIYHTETYNFSVNKLLDYYTKGKLPKNEGSILIWVEDITWVSELFIVILFSCGFFAILNINLQTIKYLDISSSIFTKTKNFEEFACPLFLYSQKLSFSDKLSLISSKKRGDYFFIYSMNYSVCFQIIDKNYEFSLSSLENHNESFDDFLYLIKYFQMYPSDYESELFDKIHIRVVKFLKDLYNLETEVLTMPNENISQIFNIFVKFIKIFRSMNILHESNLTLISYLIGVTNDFFNHLLNFKETWLAFLLIGISETYLLKHLKLKNSRKKLDENRMKKNDSAYYLLNPTAEKNSVILNFNKISQKNLLSRQRIILIFFSLIEFRNNQALNINVLYFVLAKVCMEKMKKDNLLDDVHTLVKIIIKNWKYLKNENSKHSRDDFVLKLFSINYKYDLLSHFIHSRFPRGDLKFQFFREFFSNDDLQSFDDLNDMYSKGGDDNLINEYNYMNNLAVIQ